MSKIGLFHCSVKSVGRATGRSSVAAAAYRAGECLHDELTGLTHDYRAKGGVIESFILTRADAPAWAQSRECLWNEAEAASTAKNARIATELELALPHELTDEQRRELVRGFLSEIVEKHGVAADVSFHRPGKDGDHRNQHAHVLITHRALGPGGFGDIANTRTIDRMVKGQMKAVKTAGAFNEADIVPTRAAWERAVNAAYEKAGLGIRVDHRSHADRGLAADPTKHLGPAATGMERRGEATDRGDINREIIAGNARRADMENERQNLAAAIAELVAERQSRTDARELRAAARTLSAARVLEAMTEKRATFTRAELVRTFARGGAERGEASALATELLVHPDVIGLRETADAAVTRYTTREVLATERQVLSDARSLAGNNRPGISQAHRNAALRMHKQLDEEQREAFELGTGRGGMAIIAGEAGTGKSTTLAAIRDAHEKAGRRVIGLAWTNSVVQDMKGDGFKEASTIAAALGRLERGADQWNRNTVLMVDEAAMLSSRALGRVMSHANAVGAKVILTGDDQQLASIERGGLFGALKSEHGAAELHTVYRVSDQAQKQAYNLMHEGRFGDALAIFDRAGAINWTHTQDEARAALVSEWATDSKADPAKSRFVFAYSNKDVDALNADLRAVRRERGELGEDHILRTRDGLTAFAVGDRVQFTASAYGRDAKAAGLVTGGMGELRAIDGARVTVELDGKGGKKGRLVSFTVGDNEEAGQFDAMRHGYAGTIYKGQGRTLDQSYLYHSASWRAASSYVALSRHREKTALFVAREVTRGAEPWMMGEGGLEGLDDRQRQSAERSYETWAEEKPTLGARYGLADYVAYVQEKQGERGRSEFDLDQLTRQISRADETRSASQFVADDQPQQKAAGGGSAARPRLAGPNRYEALKEAAREAARRIKAPVLAAMAELRAAGKAATGNPIAPAGATTAPRAPVIPTPPVDPMLAALQRMAAERATPTAGKYENLKPQTPEAERTPDLMRDFVQKPTRDEAEDRRTKDQEQGKGKGLDL